MDVKQIAEIVNTATEEATGVSGVVTENLGGTVETGDTIFNANAVDKYVKALVNHIGKVVFVDRKYNGIIPSILRESWEYGSIKEKVRMETPEATENESWELEDNHSYDVNIFTKPKISAKFFNKLTTFEIPMSFADSRVKQSFSNSSELSRFVAMIYNEIDKSIKIKTAELIKRAINNAIAQTVYTETSGGSISGRSGVKAVNLLYEYNQQFGTSLTAAKAMTSPDFLKFAVYKIGLVADRLKTASTLFNLDGRISFTPSEYLRCVFLSDFSKAIAPYSLAPAYHEEYLRLPEADTVPYWQGSGTDFTFSNTSKIDVVTADGDSATVTGVLGVMFDRDAVGVCNENRRTTTHYNGKAEFVNVWHKVDAEYLNDFGENIVVFYAA